MTRPRLRHLFLDLDGTLVDPFEGITRSLAHALEALGYPVPPRSELKTHIGPPLSDAFKSLLGTSEEAILRLAINAYRERYSQVGILENRVYDWIPETLHALRANGIDLHLVTSKPAVYAGRVLEHSGLAASFETVHGPDLDEIHLQKSVLVRRALDAGAMAPSSAALAGDRGVDLDAARENGVFSIGVMWGYGTREELGTADSLVDSPSELLARVRELAHGRNLDATD
ncbi:MAG TPA: HAD hydrolase-like protein [Candidatus Eisenbacteria bacterium]|nr:HAD hydrolase-like protein [Candidatus Eisenbacteria bacterium]